METSINSTNEFLAGVTIRKLGEADLAAVRRLAELDSALELTGEMLGAEVEGHLRKETALGEHCATTTEHTFALSRKFAEQCVGEDELQDGISQKFEPLVMRTFFGMILQIRTVRQGLGQQRRLVETMADALLQGGQLPGVFSHDGAGGVRNSRWNSV